jgi:acetyl/propionyl-CoA carboxylase alpha subunit
VSETPRAEIQALGNGRYEVVEGTTRRVAYAVRDGQRTWVFLEGHVHVVDPRSGNARRAAAHHDDELELAAPMPATVVAVNVVPGQRVVHGDVLVTLEAMKMELAIRAPRDATVRRVACAAGELVQPGVPLLEIE